MYATVPRALPGLVRVFECFAVGACLQVTAGVHFCQPEVEQFRLAGFGDEDVGRLDISVDDAFGMSGIEGVGDLDPEFEHEVDGKRPSIDTVFEGLTFEEFHRQKGAAFLFADIIDGADVWGD